MICHSAGMETDRFQASCVYEHSHTACKNSGGQRDRHRQKQWKLIFRHIPTIIGLTDTRLRKKAVAQVSIPFKGQCKFILLQRLLELLRHVLLSVFCDRCCPISEAVDPMIIFTDDQKDAAMKLSCAKAVILIIILPDQPRILIQGFQCQQKHIHFVAQADLIQLALQRFFLCAFKHTRPIFQSG